MCVVSGMGAEGVLLVFIYYLFSGVAGKEPLC